PRSRVSRHRCLRYRGSGGLLLVTLEKFTTQGPIGFGTAAASVVFENAFAETGCFAQPNRARYHRFVNAFTKMSSHFSHHLTAQLGASIEHRHHDAADRELIVS